jgi:hypothetical protein
MTDDLECIWTGRETPRALKRRHEDHCADEWCKGCLRCPRYHCVVCGIEHVDQLTCPGCVGDVRDNLTETLLLHAALPSHAVSGGNLGQLEAARPIPGGEAMNMLGPSGWRGEIGKGEHRTTEEVLVCWEDDWRNHFGARSDELVSLHGAARFLLDRLSTAAQEHPAFDAFAEEVRQHRAHLEDVLHDGERADLGAPCTVCHQPLERVWAKDEAHDRWWCERCKTAFDPAEYVQKVAREARKYNGWLTARDMHLEHDIPVGTLQGWASKSKVRKRKDVNLGRMVYNVHDAKTERDRLAADEVA